MASVRKQVDLDAPPERVWDAVRDFVQREPLVDLDDHLRRLVHTAVDSPLGATHYNASVQVFPDVGGTRLEWVVDVLPDGLRDLLDGVMDAAAGAMRAALGREAP